MAAKRPSDVIDLISSDDDHDDIDVDDRGGGGGGGGGMDSKRRRDSNDFNTNSDSSCSSRSNRYESIVQSSPTLLPTLPPSTSPPPSLLHQPPLPPPQPPFYLLKPSDVSIYQHDSSYVSLADIIDCSSTSAVERVTLFNYMIDLEFLFEECPILKSVHLNIVHNQGLLDTRKVNIDSFVERLHVLPVSMWFQNPVSRLWEKNDYGTHHSKMAIVEYTGGVRVAMFTANFIPKDFRAMTNAVYVQDFPKIPNFEQTKALVKCEFLTSLLDYLHSYSFDGYWNSIRKGYDDCIVFEELKKRIESYDFSSARVQLVTSTPGRHKSKLFGQSRLRYLLKPLKEGSKHSRDLKLVIQCSSISSLGKDNKLLVDLVESMNVSSLSTSEVDVELVWPTYIDVINSVDKGVGGNSMPSSFKNFYEKNTSPLSPDLRVNMEKFKEKAISLNHKLLPCFQGSLCRWDGCPFNVHQHMPHMKCYFQYRRPSKNHLVGSGSSDSCSTSFDVNMIEISWFLLTSHNLSGAAWGEWQKDKAGEDRLYIKSFEVGVLFAPAVYYPKAALSFSCTPNHNKLGNGSCTGGPSSPSLSFEMRSNSGSACDKGSLGLSAVNHLNTFTCADGSSTCFPIPFKVPPAPYNFSKDFPWIWNLFGEEK